MPSPLLTASHSSLHHCFIPSPNKRAGGHLFLLLPVRAALGKCQILKANLEIISNKEKQHPLFLHLRD